MASDSKKKSTSTLKLLLPELDQENRLLPTMDRKTPVISESFTNIERFKELVQDIVSFEVSAKHGSTKAISDSTPGAAISLTKARISGLESMCLDTPGKVMRMINSENTPAAVDTNDNQALASVNHLHQLPEKKISKAKSGKCPK